MRGVTLDQIDLTDARGAARWRAFVDEAPEASFFHRWEWLEIARRVYGRPVAALMASEGGETTGILPLVYAQTLGQLKGGRPALISTAFTVGGGIAARTDSARAALAAAAAKLGEDAGVSYVELRDYPGADPSDDLPGWRVKTDVYATFRRSIPRDEAACLSAIPRKKRADVRKGIAAAPRVDVQSGDGPLTAQFYALYAESLRNLGTPVHGRKWFQTLAAAFGDSVEISAVRGPEGPVAALMSFYHRDQVLPYYGGAQPAARRLRAYDYMYWTQMRRASDRGTDLFDFGRSKLGTGAFDYKTHWGFDPEPLRYCYRLIHAAETPDMNPNSPKFARAVRLWRRLPLWAANRLGPVVARRLA